ncbi:hypothetical protein ACGGZK_06605 [Agromyces sp. MMS24-K17]|uniref:hypothetical protein n=1 Tax=Agromyces sp. MMS24-K17 TaxID=3372850 RepID=UPI0037552D82
MERVPDLLSPASSTLGIAVLPVIALAGALLAAVAMGSLLVAWLRKPTEQGFGTTDPMTAGIVPVAFVSGEASARWLAATVLQLAVDGTLAIHDRREPGDEAQDAARRIRLLVASTEPSAVSLATEPGDPEDGTLAAMLAPGQTGPTTRPRPGATVDLDRVVTGNAMLRSMTQRRFHDAAELYREPRPSARFRLATLGSVMGLVLGALSLTIREATSDSVAWSAIGIAAAAGALRVLLPRFIPLNGAGLVLRARANDLRRDVAEVEVETVAAGERMLPWAILFGEPSVVDAVGRRGEEAGTAPSWYRSTVPFTAERFGSCLALVTAQLSQPIRVGGRSFARGDDSRFGVPLLYDTRGWGGGYLAGGDGGAGWGAATAYDGGFGDGGGGGFDGGGGGFDGGGFGGFDGGGGGGDGGG